VSCAVTSMSATLTEPSGLTRTQAMTLVPGSVNLYSTTFPAGFESGWGTVEIQATCADQAPVGWLEYIEFIDPSGRTLDACTGQPLAGATVTLLKNEPLGSPTYVVPDAGEHVPANNPQTTAADGVYGWDVVPGRWTVRVSKAGYATVTVPAFDVPPPVMGLDITLTPIAGCNTAPVAADDTYATDKASALRVAAPGVLANDADAEHDALSAQLVTGAAHGAVALLADGSFTYTPDPTFSGADRFTYKATDGHAESNVATVTITVRAVNRSPLAKDDSYTTTKNRAFFIAAPGVLGNDMDPEGARLTARLVRGAAHGVVLLQADGSFVYLPRPGFTGTDSFTYRAGDGVNTSNAATVTIHVVKKDHDRDEDEDGDHDRDDHDHDHDDHERDHDRGGRDPRR
jgi:VCBS repeat-containing protein